MIEEEIRMIRRKRERRRRRRRRQVPLTSIM